MANLTRAQIRAVWLKNAKGTKYDTAAWANLMSAIALAESSGNPSNLNPNDNNGKQSSFGLWQISNGNHVPPAPNWADPNENAKLAIAKLNTAQGLKNWGTYTNGAYKKYLSGAVPTGTGTGGGAGGSGSGSSSTSGAPNPDCLISWPEFGLGPVHAGGGCIFSKSQARAVIGGIMVVPGIGLSVVGAVVLAAFAFRRSGAGRAVGDAAEATGAAVAFIPGGEAAGAAVAASGSAAKRDARRQTQKREAGKAERAQRASDRNDERQYDEYSSRKRDSAKGPAPRDRDLKPAPF